MKKQSKAHSLLREPLLHFMAIGAALFFLFSQIGEPLVDNDRRIVITQADLDQLAAVWLKRAGRPPTAQDREQQLKYYIREQVLYREAMVMGLDKNDAIVRRRLAKKMQYLFNDLSFIAEPTETDLTSFLSEYPEKFTQPASIFFSQIYLDPGRHGEALNEDAKQLLEQLNTTTEIDAINLGDRSLLPYSLSDERKSAITSMFGEMFAQQVFDLPTNNWQGPITSEYGLHLIFIHTRTDARLPPLDEIRQRVASEWRTLKQHQANENFYQSLHQRYQIILDADVAKETAASGRQ